MGYLFSNTILQVWVYNNISNVTTLINLVNVSPKVKICKIQRVDIGASLDDQPSLFLALQALDYVKILKLFTKNDYDNTLNNNTQLKQTLNKIELTDCF